MSDTRRSIAESVKDGIIRAIRGSGDIVNTTVDTVSGALATCAGSRGASTRRISN
jgi:hypothetical protein